MAKGNPWERKALLKEFREKHGFSVGDADSIVRARNETTRRVLEKLNAVGASPEQQKEDLDTYLDAHVKRYKYEWELETQPDEKYSRRNSFIMYVGAAILTSIGTFMYLEGDDPTTTAFMLLVGVALIIITFFLRIDDKNAFKDNAELLKQYQEDYEEADAKMDELLIRIGPITSAEDTQTDEELEAEVEKYLDDNF